MGHFKREQIKKQEEAEAAVDPGGRPKLTVGALLATEQMVGDFGHHATALKLGITYHGVRRRMRQLDKLRAMSGPTP